MLVWSSNLVDFQALIQTNFLQNRSLKIYFPLVTGHPVHMYIAEVYLLHCSSNLVAPSSPPRASTMYPVCISLSLFLSSSLSAFHVHAHGFISLSLSLSSSFRTLYLRLPPLYPSPSRNRHPHPHSPFHSAPTSENGFPTWTWNGFRKVLLTCGHPRKHTPHTWPHSVRVSTIRARTATHTHTHTHIPDRYYDDRYARTTFFPSSPPLFLSSRAPPRISSGPFATGWQPARIHWCYHEPGHRSSTCSISVGSAISKWIFLSSSSCLSLLCVRACVCVCVRVFFFHCNHAAYTVKRGHDREVGGRGPRGLFKRIRFHERAFFLPLSFSFFAIVFFWFFFSSFSPFVRFYQFFLSFFALSIFFVPSFFPSCSLLFVSFFRTIGRFRCYWREWMDIGETVVCERFLYWRVSCYSATAWLG